MMFISIMLSQMCRAVYEVTKFGFNASDFLFFYNLTEAEFDSDKRD